MRRWNGWGIESITVRLPGQARALSGAPLCRGTAPQDAACGHAWVGLQPGQLVTP
ncbi:hypothetical protein ABIB38_001439 [Massilia sp. UYP11]|uniref:hypothetical protein n=1 Tax=Massilia sp. UYP11 TaxID=1756385 RepID=UPI003D1FD2E4